MPNIIDQLMQDLAARQAQQQAAILARAGVPSAGARLGLGPSPYLGAGLARPQVGAPMAPTASMGQRLSNFLASESGSQPISPRVIDAVDSFLQRAIPLSSRSLPEGGVPKPVGPPDAGGGRPPVRGRRIPLADTPSNAFAERGGQPGYDPVAEYQAMRPRSSFAEQPAPPYVHAPSTGASTFEHQAMEDLARAQAAQQVQRESQPLATARRGLNAIGDKIGEGKDALLRALGGFAQEELGAAGSRKAVGEGRAKQAAAKLKGMPAEQGAPLPTPAEAAPIKPLPGQGELPLSAGERLTAGLPQGAPGQPSLPKMPTTQEIEAASKVVRPGAPASVPPEAPNASLVNAVNSGKVVQAMEPAAVSGATGAPAAEVAQTAEAAPLGGGKTRKVPVKALREFAAEAIPAAPTRLAMPSNTAYEALMSGPIPPPAPPAATVSMADRSLGELGAAAAKKAWQAPGAAMRGGIDAAKAGLALTPRQIGGAALGAAPPAAGMALVSALDNPQAFAQTVAHPLATVGSVAGTAKELAGDAMGGGIQEEAGHLWRGDEGHRAAFARNLGEMSQVLPAARVIGKAGDSLSNLLQGDPSGDFTQGLVNVMQGGQRLYQDPLGSLKRIPHLWD